MKFKVAWVCILGCALFVGRSHGGIQPGDDPATAAAIRAQALGEAPPPPVPVPGAPANAAAAPRTKIPPRPAVAPEDEPVAEAVAPADNSETPAEPADSTAASTPEYANPYDIIVDRNIFRLNPAPVAPPPPAPVIDLPIVKISGFSDSGPNTTAFFATVPKAPGEPVTYFALTEKAPKDGMLELVKIHPGQEEVDVLINGTPTTLSVKSNSFVPPVAAAPAKGAPGMQPQPVPGQMPGMNPRGMVPNAGMGNPMGNPAGAGTAVIAGGGGDNTQYRGGSRGGPVTVGGGTSYVPPASVNVPGGQLNMNPGQNIPMRPTRIPPAYPPETHLPPGSSQGGPPPIPGQQGQ